MTVRALLNLNREIPRAAGAPGASAKAWYRFLEFQLQHKPLRYGKKSKKESNIYLHILETVQPLCLFRQFVQRLSFHHHFHPLLHGSCSDLLVEFDAGFIPFEDTPFQTSSTHLNHLVRQISQELKAIAFTSRAWLHVEVFEIDSGSGAPCRIVIKEKCHADRNWGRVVGSSRRDN